MANDYGRGRGRKARIAKAERKVAWNQAIREGRVVRFPDAFREYHSPAAAQAAVRVAQEDGFEAAVVDPALAL